MFGMEADQPAHLYRRRLVAAVADTRSPRSPSRSQFRSTLADAQCVTGDRARILVDHQLEAFCQKGLQHEVSGRQRVAVRNLADHVEQVGTEPAWPPAMLSGIPKHPRRRAAGTANVGTLMRSSFAVHKSRFWQVLGASAEVRPAFGLSRALLGWQSF